eukprot:1705841-Pyramimonas_sp.AAC.1
MGALASGRSAMRSTRLLLVRGRKRPGRRRIALFPGMLRIIGKPAARQDLGKPARDGEFSATQGNSPEDA